jgi:aminoglycoside phosphotransferase family enzyme/predicted kinase
MKVPLDLGADRDAQIRETHSGVVVLIADRAYKVKKPVHLGFLDFRTEPARHNAVQRELELNRRLAPDVYLDVAEMRSSDASLCEHVLVMRRMPDERRLSTLLANGVDVRADLDALAQLIADFHASAARNETIAESGRAPALRRRWNNNLAETEQYRGSVLDPRLHEDIARLARRYIDGRAELLDERAAAGNVVDGHGDLIAEDIFCLPDGPRVLDCLEFDDALRWVDVLDDVAFLAMDLERLGHAELGRAFLHRYAELSTATQPPSLQHHYVAYRAFVRAKVSCIRAAQGDAGSATDAHAFAELALAHLRTGEISLVLVGGAPGTGKTTLARSIAHHMDALVLSSDEVRTQLAQRDPYAPEAKRATYRTLLARAGDALRHGRSVVADATWPTETSRELARHVADSTASRIVELECRLPVELAAARAQHRLERGGDSSEAGADVAHRLVGEREPWPRAVPLDTAAPPDVTIASAERVLDEGHGDAGPRTLPRSAPSREHSAVQAGNETPRNDTLGGPP